MLIIDCYFVSSIKQRMLSLHPSGGSLDFAFYLCIPLKILYTIAADPWSVTMTSVVNGCCMGVTGILLVSSALLAASLISTNVDIIYTTLGLVAGK
jgi:hypothetical protein